jgi:hypothetical protein
VVSMTAKRRGYRIFGGIRWSGHTGQLTEPTAAACAEAQASLRTRERQRQLLNDRLQADSMATPAASQRGRSSTRRSVAGRSDCDDATRSQHEAMTAYARNSSLSRISSASLATASRLAAPRPLTPEAAAARVSIRSACCPCHALLQAAVIAAVAERCPSAAPSASQSDCLQTRVPMLRNLQPANVRPVDTSAVTAQDAKLRERLRKEEEELAVAMAVSKSEAEAAEAALAEPISLEDAEAITAAQVGVQPRSSA